MFSGSIPNTKTVCEYRRQSKERLVIMAQNYYQREIETMSAEEVKKLESEKIVE